MSGGHKCIDLTQQPKILVHCHHIERCIVEELGGQPPPGAYFWTERQPGEPVKWKLQLCYNPEDQRHISYAQQAVLEERWKDHPLLKE